jgi:high-affinity Fe2+/Pb2+ permease
MAIGQMRNVILGLGVAILLTFLFYIASVQIGGYDNVDIQGGLVYTFVLSLIISLAVIPKLTSAFKREKIVGH